MRLRRVTCGRCGRKHLRPFLAGDDKPCVPWHRVPVSGGPFCPHSGEPVDAAAAPRKVRRRR